MKKSLTYVVAIATIVWSLGLGALIPAVSAAYVPVAGDVIKVNMADRPAVYIVGADLKPYVFSTRNTYGSWLDDFSVLKNINQVEFDAMDLGGNVTLRPGTLMKFDNSVNTYTVVSGNKLCKLPADADAKILYGVNYASRAQLIQVSFLSNYTVDPSCALTKDSKLPNGSLIQYAGSADVYYIENGLKRLVSSEAFLANNFKTANIVANVPLTKVYDAGASVTGEELGLAGVTMTNPAARVMTRSGKVTFINTFADGYGFQHSSEWKAAVNQYDSANALFGPQANSGSGLGGVEVKAFSGDLNAWLDYQESNVEISYLSKNFTKFLGLDAVKVTYGAISAGSAIYFKNNGKIYSIYINSNNAADLEKYNQIVNSFYFIQ